uniref:C-type lectin domain-containing protein n=1 Tax=Xiphophorus couchianus TaxID=32473 RepID=A0A3B5LSX5_9TELE
MWQVLFTKTTLILLGLEFTRDSQDVTECFSSFCLGSLTWPKAQQFCREHYTDLATFESLDDIKRLQPNISYSWAWIGLWDDPNAWQTAMGNKSNSWRWSATGETSKTGYQSWATGDPDFRYSGEMCTFMDKAGYWYDTNCEHPEKTPTNTGRTYKLPQKEAPS